MKPIFFILLKAVLYAGTFGFALPAAAQITLPGGTVIGGNMSFQICQVQTCFANAAAKARYEQENNCRFLNNTLCGGRAMNDDTQCCGKNAANGSAKIMDRVNQRLDPDFDWDTYRQECPALKQSEGEPNALWRQCVVGQRHAADDHYAVALVEANGAARSYCIDGCSTPPNVVAALHNTNVFLARNKDNPSGFPTASFFNACAAHDRCYQTCNSNSQQTCDNRLLTDMLAACRTIPANHLTTVSTMGISHDINTRDRCITAANNMHTGLSTPVVGGIKAFNNRRQQYCQCC